MIKNVPKAAIRDRGGCLKCIQAEEFLGTKTCCLSERRLQKHVEKLQKHVFTSHVARAHFGMHLAFVAGRIQVQKCKMNHKEPPKHEFRPLHNQDKKCWCWGANLYVLN